MAVLDRIDLEEVRQALRERGLDGWLLYDFHGVNPVTARVLGIGGMATRRLFVLLPATGDPVAVAHRIELQPLDGFPGTVHPYARWEELHGLLENLVRGKRLAMEVSPEDGVPYLDRVPAGVVELIRRFGGEVIGSADLVTMFAARWSQQETADHRYAAEALAGIARSTMAEVITQVGSAREYAVQQAVVRQMQAKGLTMDHPPIVGFGPNAANPHYEPRDGADALLEEDAVVLLDLWGGRSLQTVFADQTWMGFAGGQPPDEVVRVWETVRDARDAAIDRLRSGIEAGEQVSGADLDIAARGLITERGYGDAFVHRTGHSIDIDLHGSGPHLDSYETDDRRILLPGVGFSVEPGVYLTGRFGVRSEVNVMVTAEGPVVTPATPQIDLIVRT
ncbi:MAG TPA: M24 family metallopeptidase [Gemmatimonadales bacterium]